MYRVAGNMMDSYYGEDVQKRKSNLDMPHVTVNNKRMTNVQLPGGEVIQGIRRNKDLNMEEEPSTFSVGKPVRPLRYTPGLKCDPALEALRPERDMKHQPIQGGDQWKRKLIQHPQTYEGSFADADMQKFRPNPMPSPMEDPWYMSRLPDAEMMGPPQQQMMMGPPQMGGGGMGANPYDMVYPEDELSRIKMRNRRFQQSCAMEGVRNMGPNPGHIWRGPVLQPPAAMMNEEMMMMGPADPIMDDLSSIEQDLNMTRRATRPFVPTNNPGYFDLQRQVNLLETMPMQPIKPARFNADEFLSADMLPAPKARGPKKEAEPEKPKAAAKDQVRIADQIAIRSYVLAKSL